MTAKLGPLVGRLAGAMGATVEPRTVAALTSWLDRLVEWNARIDLTAARSEDELVDLMLADAVFLSTRIDRDSRVVDVGTGAGAPGLALALLRDDLKVTLVEPLGKRASFLRTAIGGAGRPDILVKRDRGDDLAGQRAWDVAISRATLPPEQWLNLATNLVPQGGLVWCLLAKESPAMHANATVESDTTYAWPLTNAHRRAVSYRVT